MRAAFGELPVEWQGARGFRLCVRTTDDEIVVAAFDEIGRELLETAYPLESVDAALAYVRDLLDETLTVEVDYDEDGEWLGAGTVRSAPLASGPGENVSRRSFNGTYDVPKEEEPQFS